MIKFQISKQIYALIFETACQMGSLELLPETIPRVRRSTAPWSPLSLCPSRSNLCRQSSCTRSMGTIPPTMSWCLDLVRGDLVSPHQRHHAQWFGKHCHGAAGDSHGCHRGSQSQKAASTITNNCRQLINATNWNQCQWEPQEAEQ